MMETLIAVLLLVFVAGWATIIGLSIIWCLLWLWVRITNWLIDQI